MEPEEKILISGDDPIQSLFEDWFNFAPQAQELTEKLYIISNSSSVCSGVIGGWGTGKSSFLQLMESYIEEKMNEWNCVSVWFIAWRPGEEDIKLGDEFLYRIYDSVIQHAEGKSLKNYRSLKKQFDNLKRALGMRHSLSDYIRSMTEKVEKIEVVPDEAKGIASITRYIIEKFQSGHNIRESFKILSNFLNVNKYKVYFFIDELDRAEGKDIYNLLSEVKAYLHYKHIVIVLGYDESYILNCLKEYLPTEIEPKDYMEKIISIKKNIPVPSYDELRIFSENLLLNIVPNIKDHIETLSRIIATLCYWNPKKLKRITLSFIQHLPQEFETLSTEEIVSLLYLTAFNDAGILDSYYYKVHYELVMRAH